MRGLMNRLRAWFRGTPVTATPVRPVVTAATSPSTAEMLAEAARAVERDGNPARAATLYAQVLEREHDNAAAHCGLGDVWLAQGRAEEALDSYELAAHFDPRSVPARRGCGSALLALERDAEALTILAALAAEAPDNAAVRFWHGRALKSAGTLAAARGEFEAAAQLAQTRADYANLAGYTAFQLGDYPAARRWLTQALAAAPASAEARHNLGLLALETGDPAAALANLEGARAVSPQPAATQAAIGHALRDLGRLPAAIAAYDAALALDPGLGDALLNRCYARLMREDYALGWDEYEQRFAATGTGAGGTGAPRWNGEPLGARRLLIYGEQGLGDEIMFASCVPEALARAGGPVTIACDPRLAALFRRAFPAAAVVEAPRGARVARAPLPAADVEIPVGSLPRLFRGSVAAFAAAQPFLRADPARVAYWRQRLSALQDGPWLALAWRGGSLRTRSHQRSLPLAACAPLFGLGHGLVSVQYGDSAGEIAALQAADGPLVHAFPEALADLDETAAVLAAVDGVVTVDNTIAHLAGALGRPGCVLLPASPEWRYPRSGSRWPWYPNLRLARQSAPGEWAAAIADAAGAVQSQFAARSG
jgi:tetratricopeptide (TPR) repeat protein